MKKKTILLLMILYWHNGYSQELLGNTGQFNIPTADIPHVGTFKGGASYMPEEISPFNFNTAIYYVDFTFFSFFEITFRETLLKCPNDKGENTYSQQDRSTSFRARLFKEGNYMPAIVIGTNDPYADQGNNYYASVYAVATKSLCLGSVGVIKVSAGYAQNINKAQMFKGIFSGIRYVPQTVKDIYAACEYDTKGFNIGLGGTLFHHLGMNVWTREFKSVSGGINYIYTIKM
jgi:hypothetical protein